jgi:hypothetical protein
MKRYLIFALICVVTLTNCSISNNDSYSQQVYKPLWNLTNVSGGIAGVDNDFDLEDIVWSFNEATSTLTVTNNNTDDSIEDGLTSGNYDYSVIESGDNLYLVINSNEFGGLTISENLLVIDQNMTTSGTGADGFIYTFQKTLVLEE